MDRTVPVDTLLEHASFLRALAGHLVREPADADDAVQETWRTSLTSPPQRGGSVRAWLSTVLRNVVRQDARGRGRRHAREEAAAHPERTASTHAQAARRETIRHVADAVLALPEPMRETVLLRYYEGLPPRAIALRMDVPVATVKSRLVRARERLRTRLSAYEPDWRAALLPLAGPGVAAGASVGSALGGIAMASNVKLVMATVLVLLLLGAGGWLAWDGFGSGSTDDAVEHGAALDAVDDDEDAGPSLRAAGTAPTPKPLSPEALARRAEDAAGDAPAVPVPQLQLQWAWELRDGTTAGWELSSDNGRPAGSTLHADWMNGWHQPTMDAWTRACINERRDCAGGTLGDGRKLDPRLSMGDRRIPKPHTNAADGLHCNGRPATIIGTNRADTIVGTPGDDVIVARGGNDAVDGLGGNDVICGGKGADRIDAGAGDDEVFAGPGGDVVHGGAGKDFIDGQRGDDELHGDAGNDAVRGGAGDDDLYSTQDYNVLMGGRGNDTLTGGWWIDRLYGGGGNDMIDGVGADDRINGGRGTDTCVRSPVIRKCE